MIIDRQRTKERLMEALRARTSPPSNVRAAVSYGPQTIARLERLENAAKNAQVQQPTELPATEPRVERPQSGGRRDPESSSNSGVGLTRA